MVLSFIVFILRWKESFLIIELIVSFAEDSKRSSGLLKRFNESVTDPKCLLNCLIVLITIYHFHATFYFLVYCCFIWEVQFTFFSKWFVITININFLKVLQFALFMQISTKLSLKFDNVTRIFDLFALFLRRDLVIICLRRFLLKWIFFILLQNFCFLGSMFI